ncbi:hypothetical protein BJ085DRAFT_32562 [Dimargaris cristalligena]|uniref:Pentacotripeptide-repeat region of PRORP domain-containing protein n=1 Tax=Dimargaris cristalligena TaxID=215637 RepID=A0A4Q0A0L0_9FUNG|nr:hypothetical protein BJ085DRAFT_32562 [Dimargaris cristalligena]|eukprot:RKP38650.1 hypothetical protein BJ085DRAFT_32562 [Dimargaris cristalligena]
MVDAILSASLPEPFADPESFETALARSVFDYDQLRRSYLHMSNNGLIDQLSPAAFQQALTLLMNYLEVTATSIAHNTPGGPDQSTDAQRRHLDAARVERLALLDRMSDDFEHVHRPLDLLRGPVSVLQRNSSLRRHAVRNGRILAHSYILQGRIALACLVLDRFRELNVSAPLLIIHGLLTYFLRARTRSSTGALAFLKKQLPQYRYTPDAQTGRLLMQLCVALRAFDEGYMVLRGWLSHQFPVEPYVFITLFRGFASTGQTMEAREMLKHIPHDTSDLSRKDCNQLILGLLEMDNTRGALQVYRSLKRRPEGPDRYTIDILLMHGLRSGSSGGESHPHLVWIEELYVDTQTYHIPIDSFLRGNFIRALGLLPPGTSTPLDSLVNDASLAQLDGLPIIVHNQILQTLVRRGCPERAVAHFEQLTQRRGPVTPNVFTLAIMLRLAIHHRSDLLERMMDRVQQFRDQPWDRALYGLMIRAHLQLHEVDAARALFDRMVEHKLPPDAFVFGHLIAGLCENRALDSALAVRAGLARFGLPTTYSIYRSLLRCALALGRLEAVSPLVADLKRDGLALDNTMYATVIAGLLRGRRNALAVAAVDECQALNIPFHRALYTAAITALARNGELERAWELLERMRHREDGYTVDPALLVGILKQCKGVEHQGIVAAVSKLIDSAPPLSQSRSNSYSHSGPMPAAVPTEKTGNGGSGGIQPLDLLLFNTLIRAYREVDQPHLAFQVWDQIIDYGLRPNNTTLIFLFETCVQHQLPAHIDEFLQRAQHLGLRLTSPATAALLRAWCQVRAGEQATRLLLSAMRARMFTPSRKLLLAVYLVTLIRQLPQEQQMVEQRLSLFYDQLFPEMARLQRVSIPELESTLDELLSNEMYDSLFESGQRAGGEEEEVPVPNMVGPIEGTPKEGSPFSS